MEFKEKIRLIKTWEKKLKNIYTKHLSPKIKNLIFILNESVSKELDPKTIKLINLLIESLVEFKESKLKQIALISQTLSKSESTLQILAYSEIQIKKIESLFQNLNVLLSLKEIKQAQNIILSLDKLNQDIETKMIEETNLLNKLK